MIFLSGIFLYLFSEAEAEFLFWCFIDFDLANGELCFLVVLKFSFVFALFVIVKFGVKNIQRWMNSVELDHRQ